MTAPLEFSFTVECSRQHAFDTWTRKTDAWWPKDHTLTGDRSATVLIEPFVGGRILERAPGGTEHEWGAIVAWEPPRRFAYHWYIVSDASDASLVDVQFHDVDEGTRIDIHHSGWDQLGRDADLRRRNQLGWAALIPCFEAACRA